MAASSARVVGWQSRSNCSLEARNSPGSQVSSPRQGSSPADVCGEIVSRFGYDLDRTVDQVRPDYEFDISCQGSVPEAFLCWREAGDWLEGVRLAISLGGDADTQACIAGALGEASGWGIPADVERTVRPKLPDHLLEVVADFMTKFMRTP